MKKVQFLWKSIGVILLVILPSGKKLQSSILRIWLEKLIKLTFFTHERIINWSWLHGSNFVENTLFAKIGKNPSITNFSLCMNTQLYWVIIIKVHTQCSGLLKKGLKSKAVEYNNGFCLKTCSTIYVLWKRVVRTV